MALVRRLIPALVAVLFGPSRWAHKKLRAPSRGRSWTPRRNCHSHNVEVALAATPHRAEPQRRQLALNGRSRGDLPPAGEPHRIRLADSENHRHRGEPRRRR